MPAPRKSTKKHNLDLVRNKKSTTDEPYSTEILEAQKMLEELKKRKEEEAKAEARRVQIEERKSAFVEFHQEVIDKLRESLPTIDSEVDKRQAEVTDLEKAKKHFGATLTKLDSYDPEKWTESDVLERSDRYEEILEKAANEHSQFLDYIGAGKGKRVKKIGSPEKSTVISSTFMSDVIRGFAFSLPLIVALFLFCLFFAGGS